MRDEKFYKYCNDTFHPRLWGPFIFALILIAAALLGDYLVRLQ